MVGRPQTAIERLLDPDRRSFSFADVLRAAENFMNLPTEIKLYELMLKLDFDNKRERQQCTIRTTDTCKFMVLVINVLSYIVLENEAVGSQRFKIVQQESGPNLLTFVMDKHNMDSMVLVSFAKLGIHVASTIEPKGVYPFTFLIDMIFPDDPEDSQDFSEVTPQDIANAIKELQCQL